MSRDEAIRRLIALDVARWGESERTASQRMHGDRSHGLAVNALGAKLTLSEDAAEQALGAQLLREAKAILTPEDCATLRNGW